MYRKYYRESMRKPSPPEDECMSKTELYWPDTRYDASTVTWAHACNTATELTLALIDGCVMMIEVDIVMGRCTADMSKVVPICAHPPETQSSLSLQMLLERLVAKLSDGQTKKGLKLDFKDIVAFNESITYIAKEFYETNKIHFPLWFNADILSGPVNPVAVPLHKKKFPEAVRTLFDMRGVLSLGWTTSPPVESASLNLYTAQNIRDMTSALTAANVFSQRITFPVRAVFVKKSIKNLQKLLNEVEDSSLTVWSAETDAIDVRDIVKLQEAVGHNRVYVDLPTEQLIDFRNFTDYNLVSPVYSERRLRTEDNLSVFNRRVILGFFAITCAIVASYLFGRKLEM